MALSPEDIERQEFALVADGYDPVEVRAFLGQIGATLAWCQHQPLHSVISANDGGPGEAAPGTILGLVPPSPEPEADAAFRAPRLGAPDDEQRLTDARERARRLLSAAQHEAADVVARAEREAEPLLADARQSALERRAELDDEVRRRLATLARLEGDVRRQIEDLGALVGRSMRDLEQPTVVMAELIDGGQGPAIRPPVIDISESADDRTTLAPLTTPERGARGAERAEAVVRAAIERAVAAARPLA